MPTRSIPRIRINLIDSNKARPLISVLPAGFDITGPASASAFLLVNDH